MFEQITMWDRTVLLYMQNHVQTPALTKVMNFITDFGNAGWFWFVVLFLLLILRKYRWVGTRGLASLVLEFVISNLILKNWVARIRPYNLFDDIICLAKIPQDLSFPSGHSGASFAVAFVLFLHMPKKYGIPAIIFAALIAVSRIYLCVHYPSDVIAGVIIGILTALIASKVAERFPRVFLQKPEENAQ